MRSDSDALILARCARGIRVVQFELGFWIAALFVASEAVTLWPEYRIGAIAAGLIVCIRMAGHYSEERQTLKFLERSET